MKDALRAGAAAALGYAGHSSAVNGLISALRDTSLRVRINAVKALEQIGDPRACEHLGRELNKSDDFKYRYRVVNALKDLGDPKADQLLVAQLRKPDASGDEAIAALNRLGEIRAVESSYQSLET